MEEGCVQACFQAYIQLPLYPSKEHLPWGTGGGESAVQHLQQWPGPSYIIKNQDMPYAYAHALWKPKPKPMGSSPAAFGHGFITAMKSN